MIWRSLAWLRHRLADARDLRADRMSDDWLDERQRFARRVEHEGCCWSFPVKKILDNSPVWNRDRLRRRA